MLFSRICNSQEQEISAGADVRLITALILVMQSYLVFHWPQCKVFCDKVDYLLHPRSIQEHYNTKPYMDQPQSEKAYFLKVPQLTSGSSAITIII